METLVEELIKIKDENSSLNSKSSTGTINGKIREHEITEGNWSLQEKAWEFYRWYGLFSEEFFEFKLENAVISFEPDRKNVLGYYLIERNGIGVENNINLNARHLDRKKWESLATLLHEMTHQWQRLYGKKRARAQRKRNYHDVEFREMLLRFGFVCDSRGCHVGLPKDPFVSFLKEHGVEVDVGFASSFEGGQEGGFEPGQSKLKKFSCGCNPPFNIRVARIEGFSAKCNLCGKNFTEQVK